MKGIVRSTYTITKLGTSTILNRNQKKPETKLFTKLSDGNGLGYDKDHFSISKILQIEIVDIFRVRWNGFSSSVEGLQLDWPTRLARRRRCVCLLDVLVENKTYVEMEITNSLQPVGMGNAEFHDHRGKRFAFENSIE